MADSCRGWKAGGGPTTSHDPTNPLQVPAWARGARSPPPSCTTLPAARRRCAAAAEPGRCVRTRRQLAGPCCPVPPGRADPTPPPRPGPPCLCAGPVGVGERRPGGGRAAGSGRRGGAAVQGPEAARPARHQGGGGRSPTSRGGAPGGGRAQVPGAHVLRAPWADACGFAGRSTLSHDAACPSGAAGLH